MTHQAEVAMGGGDGISPMHLGRSMITPVLLSIRRNALNKLHTGHLFASVEHTDIVLFN